MYNLVMFLPLHVLIALGSVAWSFYTYLYPSNTKLKASLVLVSATLITGVLLVINLQAPLLKSCFSGLLFISFSMAGIFAAQHKLTKVRGSLD